MQEIFLLKSIYSLAIVLLEIPSGWMADSWGRKKTLLLGTILSSIGIIIYSLSHGFFLFAVAEVILGAGNSFVSGADSAMLFESLKSENNSNSYVKYEGRITSAGNFAEALAGIAAGFLATFSLRTPFFFQIFISSIAIPAAYTLIEPQIRYTTNPYSIKLAIHHIKHTIIKNKNLRTSILLSSLTGTATLSFAWLVQPYFKNINIPVQYFGILWTILNLSVGISSASAYKIEGKFSKSIESFILVIFLALFYIFSGILIIREGLIFLLLFYVIRGIATPIFKNYINQYTPNEIRATILSIRNLLIRIFFTIIGPFLGWITDNSGLGKAFIFGGITYLIFTLLIIIPYIKSTN